MISPARVLAGLRDTLRLLSPAVRAERAYTARRARLIEESSAAAVEGGEWLRAGHGGGIDERAVEYPWTMSRIGQGGTLLDAGSTLNNAAMHALVLKRYGRVLHLNPFADDSYRSDLDTVWYVRADARAPSLRTGFQVITCLSTLEHIGCDNTRYGGSASGSGSDAARADAMRAMRTLLRPGGRLLLTVPFGRREDHGWFVQLDEAALEEAIAAFGASAVQREFFLHRDGWQRVTAAECRDARYGPPLRAASAVACVELTA